MAKPLRKKLFYTSADVARICETDVKTIHMWADKGRIVIFRTPGKHMRITHDNLLSFLAQYGYPLPAVLTAPGDMTPAPPAPGVAPVAPEPVGRVSSRDPFHPPECDCRKCDDADRRDAARPA